MLGSKRTDLFLDQGRNRSIFSEISREERTQSLDEKAKSMGSLLTEAQEASELICSFAGQEESLRAACRKYSALCSKISEAFEEESKRTNEIMRNYIEKWKEIFRALSKFLELVFLCFLKLILSF